MFNKFWLNVQEGFLGCACDCRDDDDENMRRRRNAWDEPNKFVQSNNWYPGKHFSC